MTNPDREEWQILDLFGNWVPAPSKAAAIGCVQDGTATALRLASSDGGVKGEPEPVAWQFQCANGAWIACDRPSPSELSDEPDKFRCLYTASPADAGMREALERIQSAYDELCVRFSGVHSDDAMDSVLLRLHAALKALTAPGATTKSDGGAKAGSSPILASKEDQRSDTHGMMPVGDNAANIGSTGVGPSDSSSTHSDVTVEELARFIERDFDYDHPARRFVSSDEWKWLARALLDQFEIRRK